MAPSKRRHRPTTHGPTLLAGDPAHERLHDARRLAAELVAPLRAALGDWFADPASAPIRHQLLLDGFSTLPDSDYAGMMQLRADARDSGYLEMLFEDGAASG